MLIINQAGDEMFVLENLISIKKMNQKTSVSSEWVINAVALECDTYITLGRYSSEISADNAYCNIYMCYGDGCKYMQMDAYKDGD